jgi:hypothetical protein
MLAEIPKCPKCRKSDYVDHLTSSAQGYAYCRRCPYPFPLDPADLAKQLAREAYHERDEARFKHKSRKK